MSKYITDTLIMLIFTIIAYSFSYIYKMGKFLYYKIPLVLIKTNLVELIPPILVIFIIIFLISVIITFFQFLSLKKIINKLNLSIISTIAMLLGISLFILAYFFEEHILILNLIASFFMTLSIGISTYEYKVMNQKVDSYYSQYSNVLEEIKILKKEKKSNNKYDLKNIAIEDILKKEEFVKSNKENVFKFKRFLTSPIIFSLLLLYLNLLYVFYCSSTYFESIKTEYLSHENKIIIDITNERLLSKEYNEVKKEFSKNLTIKYMQNIDKVNLTIKIIEK